MAKKKEKTIRITQVRSTIGRKKDQRATIRALGFKRRGQTIEKPDRPEIRGMISKVKHLVVVEED